MLITLARTFMTATRMDSATGAGSAPAAPLLAPLAAPAHPRRAGLAARLGTALGRLFG